MARSYKHAPNSGTKTPSVSKIKRASNHRVRQLLKDPEENFSYNLYRKTTWPIKTYKYIPNRFEQFYIAQSSEIPNKEECWKHYQRCRRK